MIKLFDVRFPLIFLFILLLPLSAETRYGAENAAPLVSAFLDKTALKNGVLYVLSDEETLRFIDLASTLHINVFELIDCAYRYTASRNLRISITGDSMRKIQPLYDMGKDRVLALLPVDKMIKLETGASFNTAQKALDVYLEEEHQAYIEIGTAMYQKTFGFAKISPLLFSEPYGIMVKKMIFATPLEKLELYAPGKGAIYARGISKPKRWNLWVITKIK